MSEKKNKVNVQAAVISAIVILALAGGGLFGYMYYNNVYLPAEYEKKYAIEDVDYPVETRVIYEGGWESTYKENVEAVADAMENSDAMFFLQEGGAGVSDEVLINRVWQTDKSNYEATSGMEAKNAKEIFIEDAAAFLNTNYRKIPDKTTYYIGNMFRHQTNNIFRQDIRFPCVDWEEDEYFEEKYDDFYEMDMMDLDLTDPEYFCGADEFFGSKIYEYFMEHKLKLSCENIELTKICAGDTPSRYEMTKGGMGSEKTQTKAYYFVGYADVTTEHAVGDLSDMGIFGNEGETVRVKIIATGSDFGISEVNLERVE